MDCARLDTFGHPCVRISVVRTIPVKLVATCRRCVEIFSKIPSAPITQTMFAILRSCGISDAYESEEMDVDLYV
jgi:hypothetical protein